ncbi:hypothetical protein [Petrotoga mobilis]|uniref:hypothetical protein n=1 Tax=Petrotoga mobilis TaxID=69499 RepID=UPI00059EF76E|nr:hypothetical protein [Petrotoga mobilis]
MKNYNKVLFLFLLFILSGIYSLASTVLILNSYNPGLSWSDKELEGIYSVLENEESINIYVEYLDSKRFGDDNSLNIFKEYFEKNLVILHLMSLLRWIITRLILFYQIMIHFFWKLLLCMRGSTTIKNTI